MTNSFVVGRAAKSPVELSVATETARSELIRRSSREDPLLALPRVWLEQLGWEEGRPLLLSRLPGARVLITAPSDPRVAPPVNIHLPGNAPKDHLFRQLVSAYLSGTDEISVSSSSRFSSEQVLVVREFCRRLPDLQMSFETKDHVVLRGVPGREPLAPRALIGDMARRVLRLHETAGKSWDRPDPALRTTPFGDMDDEIDRAAWLMERTLVRELAKGMYVDGGRSDAATSVNYLMAAKTLERIADHAVRIGEEGRKLAKGPAELRASLATLHDQVVRLLTAAIDLLDDPREGPANELVDAVDRLLSGREAFGRSTLQFSRGWASRGALVRPTDLVLESIRRSASYVADLGEIALDLVANA